MQPKYFSRRTFLQGSTAAALATLLPRGLWNAAQPIGWLTLAAGPIIADHTAVNQYADIPQAYIDLIKKMWVSVPGESHSEAYRRGCELLQGADSRFQVNVIDGGTPEAYTDQHLRISRATWGDVDSASGWQYSYGEEDWYTSTTAIQRTKAHLAHCHTTGPALAAMGFGWCWDTTWQNDPGGTTDPVYQVQWAGSSVGGPEGNLRWGLDAADETLTGNSVCMDTYLGATQQYIDHCQTNSYPTKVFFTTGPVDGGGNTGENGYQRHLKHEYIRTYVKANTSRILFDYADILCWSNGGQQQTTNWTDHGSTPRTYQVIHPDNMKDLAGNINDSVGHIGERGALRLAKAMWWMLARLAGWDGLAANALILAASPRNQAVRLNWELATTLPATATWRITYTGSTGTPPSPVTNIPLATRAYTLTGMTNYTPHTFTLSAMDNGSAVLTQTIQATPTDHLVYLPLIRK
jgi:hypothetical protein